jgi:tetratricopeptide (TPR) repeat protein
MSFRAICALVILVLAASARADDRGEAIQHYRKGTKSFELGLYQEAIDEYMLAYKNFDDPAILYNLAKAHRLAGHVSDALRFYKQYLLKDPNAPNRDGVREKIAELQALVDKQRKANEELPPAHALRSSDGSDRSQPAPSESVTASPVAATAPEPSHVPAPLPAPAHAPIVDRNAGRGAKIAGLVVGALGLELVADGVVCGVLAKQNGDWLSRADANHQRFDSSKESTGRTEQILEGVFLGVGAAAVVTGVVLFAIGTRRQHAGRRVAVLPTAHGLSVSF